MDKTRVNHLLKKYEEVFGLRAESVFSTSGRTELGGNHTDHNLGCVVAGSVNLDIMAASGKNDKNKVVFISEEFNPIVVDLSDLEIKENEKNTTNSIIRGVACSIVKRGGNVGGFNAYLNSEVFVGSGLSSSAAVEVLIGTIFNNFYNNDRFSTTELAIFGKEAENLFFGKPSGLMDQVACANGGIVGIDFIDPTQPIITPVKVDFNDYGYNLVVVSTGGSHADLTDDYAAIPSEMKTVSSYFGKDALRFVSIDDVLNNFSNIRKELKNDRALLRAIHFIKENNRAQKMIEVLRNGNFNEYLSLVNESGNSSFKYLQNIYSPRDPYSQGISLALSLTENFLAGSDACRVQGGGFAGTIQAYIPIEQTEKYFEYMSNAFGEKCCIKLSIRNTPTSRIL